MRTLLLIILAIYAFLLWRICREEIFSDPEHAQEIEDEINSLS